MSNQPTLWDSASATSSPASADGASRSDSPDGPTTERYGPEAAPASRGAWRDSAKVPMIRAIFGQRGSGSSASHALQSSLENRLRARMDATGSTLFTLTWKHEVTPSGRRICLLRASGRHTPGRVYGSWPTPTANNYEQRDQMALEQRRQKLKAKHGNGNGFGLTLGNTARLAHWATPTACEQSESPEVKDARNQRHRAAGKMKGVGGYKLSTQVQLSTWATPTARDWRSDRSTKTDQEQYGSKGRPLAMQTLHAASGPNANGSGTEMESTGLLNPEHSRWLQGYPETWTRFAPLAMPSSRRSRRK